MLQASNWIRPGWHAVGPILTALGLLVLVLSPVGYRMGWFGVPIALLRLIPLGGLGEFGEGHTSDGQRR